jgi:hypothetical protein
MKTVEAAEMNELASRIWDLIGQSKALEDDVRRHRQDVRIALMKMSRERPPNFTGGTHPDSASADT